MPLFVCTSESPKNKLSRGEVRDSAPPSGIKTSVGVAGVGRASGVRWLTFPVTGRHGWCAETSTCAATLCWQCLATSRHSLCCPQLCAQPSASSLAVPCIYPCHPPFSSFLVTQFCHPPEEPEEIKGRERKIAQKTDG